MKKAFTLIELLITIVVIGVILVIAIPIINNVLVNSREDIYFQRIEEIESAAKIYYYDGHNHETTVTVAVLVANGYLDEVPVDPRDDSDINGTVNIEDGIIDFIE